MMSEGAGRTLTDGNTAELQRLHSIRSKGLNMNQTDHNQRGCGGKKTKTLLINTALYVWIEGRLADLKATCVRAGESDSVTRRIIG